MPQIRPFQAPADYEHLARLLSEVGPEPITAQYLRERDEQFGPEEGLSRNEEGLLVGRARLRLIAEDETGAVIGYGSAFRERFHRPGQMYGQVLVAEHARRRGLGTELARSGEAIARDQGALTVRSSVRDNRPEAIRFAEKRGYTITNHMFESTLDVPAFDETPFTGVIQRLEAEGIHFCTLADRPGPETEEKLYALDKQGDEDVPESENHTPPFDQWRKIMLPAKKAPPALTIMAWDGKALVGLTMMHVQGPGSLYTIATVVERAYRGRKLALALKLLAIRAARRYGAAQMRTHNDSRNAPMLAVNRKLGYQPVPGVYNIRKALR